MHGDLHGHNVIIDTSRNNEVHIIDVGLTKKITDVEKSKIDADFKYLRSAYRFIQERYMDIDNMFEEEIKKEQKRMKRREKKMLQ